MKNKITLFSRYEVKYLLATLFLVVSIISIHDTLKWHEAINYTKFGSYIEIKYILKKLLNLIISCVFIYNFISNLIKGIIMQLRQL